MAKVDYPPILRPGIHLMTLAMIRETFVEPESQDPTRLHLFSLLDQWVHRLRQLNVTGTLWLDGSFVTRNPAPNDIDCILWNPDFLEPTSEAGKIEALALTDRDSAKVQFGLDLYVLSPTPQERMSKEAYWRGLFGFQHDGRSAKGFVELKL